MSQFLKPNDTILFQGDSITDASRNSSLDGLGTGYVAIIRGWIEGRHADQHWKVLNRGVGGDRTVELLARWPSDCLDLHPDVLSIKIGVNDVWRLNGEWNGQKFVTASDYETNYRELLNRAGSRGIERFVLVSPTTIDEERDPILVAHLDERTEIVRSLAKEFHAVYVPAREALNKALRESADTQWTLDGCHPTSAGHALIAATWLEAVGL